MAGAMRRFGEDLFGRRGARNAAQIAEALASHKHYLFGVRELTVRWGQGGAGQTGTRLFKAQELPAFKHWNPDIAFREVKTRADAPSVILDLANGEQRVIDTSGKRVQAIVEELKLAAPRSRA